jgi:hypothetical protein
MKKTQDPKETKKNVFDFLQQEIIFQLKFRFDLFKKKDVELVFNHKSRCILFMLDGTLVVQIAHIWH